jgi:thioredoxin 1
MKLLPLLVLLIVLSGPTKVVVVSNSIDYSPELIEYVQQEFEVISISAEEFSDYQHYQYYMVLGGPDAPEGVGDLVRSILSIREQDYIKNSKEYDLFIRVKDGKTFFVLAGADREQTKLAVTDLKDEILSYIPKDLIPWLDNLDEALQKAQLENKFVYIDFYTDWCRYCIQMDEGTYTDPRTITLLTEEVVPVKLNKDDPENRDITAHYKIFGQPVQIVVTPDGEIVWGHHGYIDADELYFSLMSLLSQDQ